MYSFILLISFFFYSKAAVLERTSGSFVARGDGTDKQSVAPSSLQSSNTSTFSTEQGSTPSWPTHLSFHTLANSDKEYQFCVIHGACRLGDGTLLLPLWMSTHSMRIKHCGFGKILYNVDVSGGSPVFEDSEGVTANMDYRDIDVVGNEAPPGERALLVEHLTPTILMMDILKRPFAYQNIANVKCLTETSTSCSTAKNDSTLRPMIFIDSRVSHTKDFMWPKSLLRLIRNCMEGELRIADLKDLYGWKVKSQALCFRSVSSTNIKTRSIPDRAFSPDHLFFSMNRLTRLPVRHSVHEASTCRPKVLLLNRYGKRFLEGSDALLSIISSYGINLSKQGQKLDVQAEEVFFEHSSFHEQVSVMQESDVVIATHGEANSNFIFLRPNATVFEILPFGLSASAYRNISLAYGIKYESVRSQPDTEVFIACIKHFNGDKLQSQNALVQRWQQVAAEFTKETLLTKENAHSNFSVSDDSPSDLKMLRECVLYQRSSVDVRALARQVIKAASNHCGLHVNSSMLVQET